eukprot:CAMPEP_0202734446 /NCGR_PEP_ID=MMETSP1385-20130828/188686_1 /ASSEMBLY_ACC=CAM_ASM_000861 /TAXON_ID=933848 /ORGANISM="Elphidium margaritaceum" /LENGTH=870 /DNA_ID=CAMNT_0049400809 /DNA_START=26 /DNA_END=2638 /DNA_ORIENTATION=+
MSTSDIITVNDTVAATQGNTNQKGYVRFIGERNNEIGTFYGVDFGATESLKFFKRNVLRLVTRSETVRITVGDIVCVKKFLGIVRYIGNIKSNLCDIFEEQIWYGVQMETAIGKNNGTVLGEQYFRCPPKHGIFVQSDNLELVKHKKNGSKSKHKKKSSKVRLGHKKRSPTTTAAAAALPTMGEEEPSTTSTTTAIKNKVTVFVQSPGGKTMPFDVDLNHDIAHLQRHVHDRTGIAPRQQVMTFAGKKVMSGRTLGSYNIDALCTLNVVHKFPGSLNNSQLTHTPARHVYRGSKIHVCKRIVYRLRDRDLQGHPDKVPLSSETRILYEHSMAVSNFLAIDKGIDELFHAFLREKSSPPLLYSGYVPFGAVWLRYNGHVVKLRFKRINYDRIATFVAYDSKRLGLLPSNNELPLCDITKFWPTCDCCPPTTTGDYHSRAAKTEYDQQDANTLFITVWLPNISFLVHHYGDAQFHYANGTFSSFYRIESEHISLRKTVPLHLWPVIKGDKDRSERLLVFGYFRGGVRDIDDGIVECVPMDIIKLILAFYPNMYGGRYIVSEHNPNLMQELVQRTKTFLVDEIRCRLKYGSANDNDDDANRNAYINSFMRNNSKSAFYLVLEFDAETRIAVVVICCCVSCKISMQSYTFLRQITVEVSDASGPQKTFIELPDFGLETTLSSLKCDLQIVNMLKEQVYEFPSFFDRDAYLLEWKIDANMMAMIRKCVTAEETGNVFESEVYYDLFKLRFYPFENGSAMVAIQLLTLPTNRPNKEKVSGINASLRIYEESHKSLSIHTCFDYSAEHSGCATAVMKPTSFNSDDLLEKDTLHLRVEIVILDSVELPEMDDEEQRVPNFHCGNSLHGIRYQGQPRRR